ncbi:MAG: Uncharacterized protein JWL70_2835 [Acidimicrobiia bacterium]|nr:Uncharacterized protein [Acidimicrobiia bacterium]
MLVKAGEQLASTVCPTRVIVVRAPSVEIDLTCGGSPMVPAAGAEAVVSGTPAPGADTGTVLGKRYADDDLGLELLATKAGGGSLAVNGKPIELKVAKPLPASD